jgi:hypothetical protein
MEKRFIGRGDKYGRLERDEAQIDADGHEPAELAAASGAHPRAFAEFENVTRPFVEANQALGLKSAKLMRSGKRKLVVDWLLQHLMRIMPGRMTEWIIKRFTERITRAANAISLKDYSSFLRSNETTTP